MTAIAIANIQEMRVLFELPLITSCFDRVLGVRNPSAFMNAAKRNNREKGASCKTVERDQGCAIPVCRAHLKLLHFIDLYL